MTENDIEHYKNRIRKDFYRFRNGAVVESLKNSGTPYAYVFGLLLPQLKEVARNYPKDIDLARALWEEKDCREFRLLSLYLLPLEILNKDDISIFINDIRTIEEAELLPFKVLRNLSYANEILNDLKNYSSELTIQSPIYSYFLKMFAKNLSAR